MSKYSDKKKRQLETGEVGYVVADCGGNGAEAETAKAEEIRRPPKPRKPALTPEEQSARDRAAHELEREAMMRKMEAESLAHMKAVVEAFDAIEASCRGLAVPLSAAKSTARGKLRAEVFLVSDKVDLFARNFRECAALAGALMGKLENNPDSEAR